MDRSSCKLDQTKARKIHHQTQQSCQEKTKKSGGLPIRDGQEEEASQRKERLMLCGLPSLLYDTTIAMTLRIETWYHDKGAGELVYMHHTTILLCPKLSFNETRYEMQHYLPRVIWNPES